MKMLRIILTAGLLLVFGGCSLAPSYQRPALPVAGSLPGADVSYRTENRGELPMVCQLGWRDVFTDPCLQQLIETSLANNRDLRETILNVQSFEAFYRIERSALWPTVNVEGFGRMQRSLGSEKKNSFSETYSLNIGTTAYELDLYGRIRNLKDQALEQYLAQQQIRKSASISLVAEVVKAYLGWLTDRELLQISEETRQVEEESYKLIEQRVMAGVATELDLAQARTSLETVKANLALYRRQVAQDLHFLTLLAGTTLPQELLSRAGSLHDLAPIAVTPPTLSSEILLERPDIMAAEHQLIAANANIGAARAAFFPTISLTADAGVMSAELGNLFQRGSGAWLFSPSISLPIFTAGRLKAELDVAKIGKEISVARYEKTIQTAFQEVSDGLIAGETYRDQLVAQQDNLRANENYYALARDRYQQGVDSFLVLLDAQRSLYSSRQNYLTLKFAQLASQADLYKALGGGWRERTAE